MVTDAKRISTFAVLFHKDGKDYQGTISLYQDEDGIVDYQVQLGQNPFTSDEDAQVWERYVLDTIRNMEDDKPATINYTRCLYFMGTKTTIRRHE